MANEISKQQKDRTPLGCPNCGYVDDIKVNIWGTVCSQCQAIIKPAEKPKFIQENEAKLKLAQDQVRNALRQQYVRTVYGNC